MNAFLASYDIVTDEISFHILPVIDNRIIDGDCDLSLFDLEKDGYATDIAVADGDRGFEDGYKVEDTPEMREWLGGILMRRFEHLREEFPRLQRRKVLGVQ